MILIRERADSFPTLDLQSPSGAYATIGLAVVTVLLLMATWRVAKKFFALVFELALVALLVGLAFALGFVKL